MNRIGMFLLVLAAVGSAAWAYHINYKTRTTLDRIDLLRHRITAEREAIEVLRVEWSYLNAPDYLAALVNDHNGELQLQPMAPEVFDEVAAIPFPPRDPYGEAPEDAVPEVIPKDAIIVSERVPLVAANVPAPIPRPAAWGRQ